MTENTHVLRQHYKAVRKALLSFTPLIRRSRYKRAMARSQREVERLKRCLRAEQDLHLEACSLLSFPPSMAVDTPCLIRMPIGQALTGEVCLFVTHAPTESLKPHVVDHVAALLDAGIAVVLIANTDIELASISVPPQLQARLSGCLVRENVGFDFAAWAHAYSLMSMANVQRLYLINDSIVGPLDRRAYEVLLGRIRNANADIVGLTENPEPQPHLQSYFLVLNAKLLRASITARFFRDVVNLPHKHNVINCYEVWLSPMLERHGFRGQSMFTNEAFTRPVTRNVTLYAWRELIEAGFPFIKTMILRDPAHAVVSRQLLPAHYLEP